MAIVALLPFFVLALPGALKYADVVRAIRKPPDSLAVAMRLTLDDGGAGSSSGGIVSDAELRELSRRLRAGGAAVIVLRGGTRALRLLLDEQSCAAREFPGPCPVLFEPVPQPADWTHLKGCGANALVLPHEACVASGGTHGLRLVPRASSRSALLAALRASAAPAPPVVFATAASWEAMDAAAGADACATQSTAEAGDAARSSPADLPRDAIVLAELGILDSNTGARARELRAAGCAGVVVDYDPCLWPGGPEGLMRALTSKRSVAYGALGLRHGVGIGASDLSSQYWLNRDMKDAKAIVKKQGAAALGGDTRPSEWLS